MARFLQKILIALLLFITSGPVMAQTSGKIYYVTYDGQPVDGGWQEGVTTLEYAIANAKAGEQIWIQGDNTLQRDKFYIVPKAGYTVKSGVSVYGGFSGKETDVNQRRYVDGKLYRLRYRTVLTGDRKGDDEVNNANYIFSSNTTRADNAIRVLTLDMTPTAESGNNNRYNTVINGITIARGHADGANGGGILVTGDNTNGGAFKIEQCFFLCNYALYGGGIYVDSKVKNGNDINMIDRCAFFNNASGLRELVGNSGGGVYVRGDVRLVNNVIFNNENGGINVSQGSGSVNLDVKVVNSTVTRNSGSGIDGKGIYVYNSVFWGNNFLTTNESTRPNLINSAFDDQVSSLSDAYGNVVLSSKNNDGNGPAFASPSLKTGFDTSFDSFNLLYPEWTWRSTDFTALVDAGSDDDYDRTNYGETDLNGNARFRDKIDIGAYEFQPVASNLIRYVKEQSAGSGDGTSWGNASNDLQKMIDELAVAVPAGQTGEVRVAKGIYTPKSYLITGVEYTSSFRMRDRVNVYGGFSGDDDTETKATRKRSGNMLWEFENETILQGNYYSNDLSWSNNKWNMSGLSRHVVWFAPLAGEEEFSEAISLDGVTIRGGYASGGNGVSDFATDCGGGIYIGSDKATVIHCTIKENHATGNGGGLFMTDGAVIFSLIYNNNADADGGAAYIDGSGIVRRSMIVNNSAGNGAGVYLNCREYSDGREHPEYQILSTSVIANNTSRINGAVYCNRGGVLMQNIIANNFCPTATDATNANASQTGGLYINEYGLLINSVLWNNRMGSVNAAEAVNVPVYVKNPSTEKVRFIYNAVSGKNNSVWNGTYQEQTLTLLNTNSGNNDGTSLSPNFSVSGQMPDDNALETKIGVQTDWGRNGKIDYFWKPISGSCLWARGQVLTQLPHEVLVSPEIDIEGNVFSMKPAIGAFRIDNVPLKHDETSEPGRYIVYVNAESTATNADGSSWDKAYRSLNDAVNYLVNLDEATVGNNELEVRVLEGNLWLRYAFVNEDAKTATLNVNKSVSGKKIRISGGYHLAGSTAVRDPLKYRSRLNGNRDGVDITAGIYHVITVNDGADVEFDGFQITNGYAAGTASIQIGAGMLIYNNADVTLKNCIFDDNTAVNGAAVGVIGSGSKLTMYNCVVNNNTNTNSSNPVISASNLTLAHVTVVNNKAAAPDAATIGNSSFAAGNEGGNNNVTVKTVGEEGTVNFVNPTKSVGSTIGSDAYYGGYSDFCPLTSSAEANQFIINKAIDTPADIKTDITRTNDRDLGGVPDKGAYEADLPKRGRTYYVRMPENGGSDSNDGLSWNKAFATVRKAVETAAAGTVEKGEKPQVWVAAGIYSQEPKSGSNNCFEILDGVNVYGAFPKTGTPGMNDRHPFISNYIYHDGTYNAADYETILQPSGTSSTRRVLGQADIYNPYDKTTETKSYEFVGAGNGNYDLADKDKYVEAAGGEYYYSATGGEYVKAAKDYCDYWLCDADVSYKYFSTYDIRVRGSGWNYLTQKDLIHVGSGYGNYTISNNLWSENSNGDYAEFASAGYYKINPNDVSGGTTYNKGIYYKLEGAIASLDGTHVLTKQGYNKVGAGYGNYNLISAGTYYEVGAGKGSFIIRSNREFSYYTRWDGFTLQEGYLDSYNIKYLDASGKRNGGAGAAIFKNVTLANSIVYNNYNRTSVANNGDGNKKQLRGGGVYCDEGSLINCYILNNQCGESRTNASSYVSFGAGVYMYSGTAYNCIISDNNSYGNETSGAGIFIENAKFFNNTITNNTSHGTDNGNGGICIYNSQTSAILTIYNCIVLGNKQDGETTGIKTKGNPQGYGDVAHYQGIIYAYNSVFGNDPVDKGNIKFTNCYKYDTSMFVDHERKNYRLNGTYGLNIGENMPTINGETIDLFDYTDMDFTDRIKDCTVDVGAYEYDSKENTKPDLSQTGKAIYYVTFNGHGTASADSPDNAACASKLQTVLTAAGEYAKNNSDKEVIVKVAGYENGASVYHVNALADPNFPQSYSYVIPYGVTVMGGYNEGTFTDGVSNKDYNWDDDNRNALEYRTIFSAIKQATSESVEVNGYHTVTFGAKPADWTGAGRTSIIDGVTLEDGAATSSTGTDNNNAHGGAAIVPAWAHVRKCVIRNNTATYGGGLYVLPGGVVSGCFIIGNTAEQEGGGIYADNGNTTAGDKDTRVRILSSTIVRNTASSGGGICLEDGAAMVVNTVVWGNAGSSDDNVSGVTAVKYEDTLLGENIDAATTGWFPFNNCFVENLELPGNFENSIMTSRRETYFNEDFTLKPFSILINHGATLDIHKKFVEKRKVSDYDMLGLSRVETAYNGRLDVGAFAYLGRQMAINKLVKRLFVSHGNHVVIEDENAEEYRGKSFYTGFTWLGDALNYIRDVRSDANDDAAIRKEARETTFEILVAAGTYKPKYRREDAATEGIDRRQNSFDVPYNVNIYGGFTGLENYSSNAEGDAPITSIPKVDGITFDGGATSIDDILSGREYSDLNQNSLFEPWELANQSILSGLINVSDGDGESRVFHVVYSKRSTDKDAPEIQAVKLDGLTVMDGETVPWLTPIGDNNELGRGGGIYSSGVDYTLVRCRMMHNKAVRGGAVFMRDGDLITIGSAFAGNSTVTNNNLDANFLASCGGAVFITSINKNSTLKAANTLWGNNSSVKSGGAIGSDRAEANGTATNATAITLLNSTFVKNKAEEDAVLHHTVGLNDVLCNTLMWGNESTSSTGEHVDVQYSASDKNYSNNLFGAGNPYNNILLSSDNMAIDGPHFANPTPNAGVEGLDVTSCWNPVAISFVNDRGSGKRNPANTDYEGSSQAYYKWFADNGLKDYMDVYITSPNMAYERYSGPLNETGVQGDRQIDMGLYEYQYRTIFKEMDEIYVATVASGQGDGTSWANATDDLRGAIIGAANPSSIKPDSEGKKNVYIRDGVYSWPTTASDAPFPLHIGGTEGLDWSSLTLHGSCTGLGEGEGVVQDFGKHTEIRNFTGMKSPEYLMQIAPYGKNVTIEGFTFSNEGTPDIDDGNNAVNIVAVGSTGSFTLKNSALKLNGGNGVDIANNAGKTLLVNILFADNKGNGLSTTEGNTVLVNTTFANNGMDINGTADIYNTVAWNNAVQNISTDETRHNKAFALNGTTPEENNLDIYNGPNFRDPLNATNNNRDYHIRPSLTLFNLGSNDLYAQHALGLGEGKGSDIPETETDIDNTARVVGEKIDIGAYEYEAILQPVIYVKSDVVGGNGDGTSWDNAMSDLQGAADLAGIYYRNMGITSYVFVHNNVKEAAEQLNVALPGVKIYGSMNDEVFPDGSVDTPANVKNLVDNLLGQRNGLLTRLSRTQLGNGLTLRAETVVDGFEIDGPVSLGNGGFLSTSIVNADVTAANVPADAPAGILYNSFTDGNVNGVRAVNVTTTGSIGPVDGNANNRADVTETNRYVTDGLWKYQLNETSTDIDGGTLNDDEMRVYVDIAGHDKDIAGNMRVRNHVDNGCFETWNITADMTEEGYNEITDNDYPHGQAVIYVRHDAETGKSGELVVKREYMAPFVFNPGFLLLEHRAGLRADGNEVSLTNFAVERNLDADGKDMAVMPFAVTRTEGDAGLQVYDAATRAAYDYKFDAENGAWLPTSYNSPRPKYITGWMLDGTPKSKMRFYGDDYAESGDKNVALVKNCFNDPWTSSSDAGNKFTHKENMSWNLFGSPYLCAMNYNDMEYGRVIHAYENGQYKAVNTETAATGYVPAGDAVFTQTATLRLEESFVVKRPSADSPKNGDAYAGSDVLAVAISRSGETRTGNNPAADCLYLNAVPSKEAKNDFDISADGVKWMSSGSKVQLYADRNGGRYSLLSAVNEEGHVNVGVTLPEAGMYTFAIPDGCNTDGYESVILTDTKTGKKANLLEGGYDFTSVSGGNVSGRFTISFKRMINDEEGNDIAAWSERPEEVEVKGLESGDVIRLYTVSGMMVQQVVAHSNRETLTGCTAGAAVVEIAREGRKVAVRKIGVK